MTGVGLLLEILLKLAQNVSQISLTGSKVLFMTFHLKRTLLVLGSNMSGRNTII